MIDTHSVNWGLMFELYALPEFMGLLRFICSDSETSNLPIDLYWIVKTNHQKLGREYELILLQHKYVRMNQVTGNPVYGESLIETRILMRIVQAVQGFFLPHLIRGDYLWEFIFERVRQGFYPEKPSRLQSYFLLASQSDIAPYLRLPHIQPGHVAQVTILEQHKLHIADMNFFNSVPNEATYSQAANFAHRYWCGIRSDTPIMEVVFQGRCLIE
jgi:hypothetical protein